MFKLNHPKVRVFSCEVASHLRLEPSFVDFVFADYRPECLRNWVEDAHTGWTCYVPEEFDVAFPLWCCNADQTLILGKGSEIFFGEGWHDNAEMEMISRTTQGLLTRLIAKLIDVGDSDDELHQAAESCNYSYLDELLELVRQTTDRSWSETLKRFIAEVDARSE